MRLSVIIPAKKEPFLQKTIDSFLAASDLGCDVEVLAVLDGPWMKEPNSDKRVKVIRLPEPKGMRGAINAGLAEATGEFLMKLDAHCAFDQGFDKKMIESYSDDRLLIPRRYSLDDINWCIKAHRMKWPHDYHYLTFPTPGYTLMTPQGYIRNDRPETIDDTMTFQGSCWLANRETFMRRVGFLDDREETYGSFAAEQLEVGLKYWLGGGEVKVIKTTWYAHLWKMPRHYATGEFEAKLLRFKNNWVWSTKHWTNNEEPNMIYPFNWLVERFWPIPGWPEDRNQWETL